MIYLGIAFLVVGVGAGLYAPMTDDRDSYASLLVVCILLIAVGVVWIASGLDVPLFAE